MSDRDNKSRELAEQNEDWLATCAIYGDATEIQAISKGFLGSISIPISTSTVAFAHKATPEGHYRYFSLPEPPILKLTFKYILYDHKHKKEEESPVLLPPMSLTVKWMHYPEELSLVEKKPFLAWLWEKSNGVLQREQLSFGVCEFCEHEALTYWTIFHQEAEYRMVLLPSKMDQLYGSNLGTMLHPQEVAHRERPSTNNGNTNYKRPPPKTVEEYARRTLMERWRDLYTTTCPICFDEMPCSEGIELPCHDFFCHDCFTSYLHFQTTELATYRTNPFLCPLEKCRQALPVIGFVKNLLPDADMERVRKWYKDLKNPPCFSLDRCLSKACAALDSMRRHPIPNTTRIYCDVCHKTWCELCLKRILDDEAHHPSGGDDCDATTALTFCQRYLQASDQQKRGCETKYPWIVSYAHARQYDGDAMTWILQNGQCCPTCQTGVERSEGCFHMQCPTCATHFCYECGDLLVPPYYGTHHCWERSQLAL
jgi:hypothetical protein